MVDKLTYYDLKENVKAYVRNRNEFVKISHMYNNIDSRIWAFV